MSKDIDFINSPNEFKSPHGENIYISLSSFKKLKELLEQVKVALIEAGRLDQEVDQEG